MSGCDCPVALKLLNGEVAWSSVLSCEVLKKLYDLLILTIADKKFWSFVETNYGYSGDTHAEYDCTRREPKIAPAHVFRSRAVVRRCAAKVG